MTFDLDAETAQLRRARWELVGQHPALADPVTLIRSEHDYTDSRLEILVPERIVFEWFEAPRCLYASGTLMQADAICS